MEVTKAFQLLGISIDSTKDAIESKFKEMSMKLHPDKGGTNQTMSELLEARELAIEFSTNKYLVKIIRELARADNNELHKTVQIDKQITSISKRAQIRVTNRLKSYKDITGIMGLISGVLGLINTKLFSILNISENHVLSTIMLPVGIILGIYYLIFSNRIKKWEEDIAYFKESIDDKDEYYQLVTEIVQDKKGKGISKNQFYQLVEEWANKTSAGFIFRSTFDILLPIAVSPKRICRLIGTKDFLKMITLKGVQMKLIEVIEEKDEEKLETKYTVK